MSLIPPIVKPDKTHVTKLPREVKVIMSYIDTLDAPIVEMLTSDKQDFEATFERTKMNFLFCMAQIGAVIGSHKDAPNLIKRLNKIYSQSLSHVKYNISKSKKNPLSDAIIGGVEVISNYFDLMINPKFNAYSPEYSPAFVSYVELSVCISALIKILQDPIAKKKNVSVLIKKCRNSAQVLESYVETIEIEGDPEQKEILKRVMQDPRQTKN
jgi:hypothetical protein